MDTARAEALSLRDVGAGRALWVREDGRLYLSRGYTIYASDDDGASWQRQTALPVTWKRQPGRFSRLAARLLRFEVRALLPLSDGTLVAANREGVFHGRAGERRMARSAVDDAGQAPMPPLTITAGPGDLVLWGEYNARTGHGTPVRLYASRDAGRSFEIVHVFAADSVMHVHSLLWDPRLEHYWVFVGDYDEQPGIGMLSPDLERFEWLRKGEQRYRLCEAFDFGDRLVYATDTPLEANAVMSLDKATGETERLLEVEGSCLYACRFGSICAFSTSVEPSAVNASTTASLWVSRDGERWSRLLEAEKDRWHAELFQFGSLILPRGGSRRETLFLSGQAVQGLDGRALVGTLS